MSGMGDVLGPIGAELLKLRRSWSTWIIGGILVVGELLLGYLLVYAILQAPAPPGSEAGGDGGFGAAMEQLRATLGLEAAVGNALSMIAGLGGALVLVLAAMNSAREYGWRTMSILLTQRPSRLGLLVAKVAALALLLLVLSIATFAAAALGSLLVTALDGGELGRFPLAELPAALAAGWLILGAWGALGFALGVLLRSTGLAIGLGLVYALVIEGVVSSIAFSGEALEAAARSLVGVNANALASSFSQPVPGFGDGLPAIEPGVAAAVIAVYLVGALLVAGAVFARRDVA